MMYFNNLTANVIDLKSNFFKTEQATEIAVEVDNTIPTEFGLFNGNTFEGAGTTKTLGFDQTTIGWDFRSNNGITDSKVSGGYYKNTSDTVNITTQNVWERISGNFSPQELERMSFDNVNDEITYNGKRPFLGRVIVTISADTASNNQTYEFSVFKNGVQTGVLGRQEFRFSGIINNVSMNNFLQVEPNDVLDVRVRNTSSTADINIETISITYA